MLPNASKRILFSSSSKTHSFINNMVFVNVLQRSVSNSAAPQQIFDVAIIGAGPGGYVAALRAAQNNLKTVCIEKRGTVGGTCLNVGCIPSKVLLDITHKYHDAKHNFKNKGINIGECSIDVSAMQKEKERIMKTLMQGVEGLFKMNKITYEKSEARFLNPNQLELIDPSSGKVVKTVEAKNIIIATGSESSPMPGESSNTVKVDEEIIITSTGALSLKQVPKKMVVIGGGVIGLEMGSVYKRLGTDIVVVEFMDRIASGLDGEVSNSFKKILEKQGLSFKLSSKVTGVKVDKQQNKAVVELEMKDGKKESVHCDKVLLSVGRRAFTQGLNLEKINAQTDKAGKIVVDKDLRLPNHSHIFAIGDVVQGAMLAHKAEDEGVAVADVIAGKSGHVNYEAIPSVVYTHPEVAGVGKTEEQIKQLNIDYKKGVFGFGANSRARVHDETEGFVKILTEKSSDKILGAWIIGPNAAELIHELVLGIEYGASSEDIARSCHAHPTFSEAIKEACLSAHFKAIHGR